MPSSERAGVGLTAISRGSTTTAQNRPSVSNTSETLRDRPFVTQRLTPIRPSNPEWTAMQGG